MPSPDYYKTLGVSEHASIQSIKAAFRRLALKYHPDKNSGDKKALMKFTRIQKAYEVLSDKTRRKEYDRLRTYRLSKFAASFASRPIQDTNRIKLFVEKRVSLTEELIPVTIHVFEAGKDFRLKGLHKFEIVEGPEVDSFSPGEKKAPLLEIKYLLRPKGIGYYEIGPASFISKGKKYLSDSVHIKVNCPPSQVRFRPATKFEKVQSYMVSLLIVTYTFLIGYNLYKFDIYPRLIASQYPELNYSEGAPLISPLNDAHLKTGVSPYNHYFGAGVFDPSSFNEIRFINGQRHDAVVCLTDNETDETIRNNYIQAGHRFSMQNIPDGSYYLKVFFGNDWNPEKRILNDQIKGAFNRNARYELFHQEINVLDMFQNRLGDTLNYKIYEITLYPVKDGSTKSIISDAEKFFQ